MCWSNRSALLSVVFLDGGRLKILCDFLLKLIGAAFFVGSLHHA